MDVQTIYKTLLHWLNSCITIEQIDLVVEVAEKFLLERHNAEKEYTEIRLAAETKKDVPETKFINN